MEDIKQNEPDVNPPPRLIAKNGLIYQFQKRITTPYIRINAQCSYCKKTCKTTGKYTIIVQTCPDPSSDIVQVNVERTDHDHILLISSSSSSSSSSPSSSPAHSIDSDYSTQSENYAQNGTKKYKTVTIHQITGLERTEIAQEIIQNHGSSAEKYRLHLISLTEKSDVILNIASAEVYRKILSQYNTRDDISTDWRQNLKASASTYSATIPAKKIHGRFEFIFVIYNSKNYASTFLLKRLHSND